MANTNTPAPQAANAAQPEAENQENAQQANGDVKVIDDVCVVENGGDLTGKVVIEKPAAGENLTVEMAPGQKYFFDFHEADVKSFVQDGDTLTLSFEDGSSITLLGYTDATSGDLPSTMAFRDDFSIDNIQVVETVKEEAIEPEAELREAKQLIEDVQPAAGEEQVAKVEPQAGEPSAQQVAQIEPAAGEEAGGQGPENSGYSFGNPDVTPVGPLNDVGPIGPTALQYGVEYQQDQVLPQEEQTPITPGNVVPELERVEKTIDETNLAPTQSVSDVVVVEFGSDGPGTLGPDGTFTSSGSQLGGTLASHGVAIVVTPTADGYVGMAGGTKVFDLVINKDTGAFTFTQYDAIDHADGTDPNDVIKLVFGVEATDADGDTANTTITINILDDVPAIAPPMVENIDETALKGGPIVVNDTLTVDFGNDGAGDVSVNGSSSFTGVASLTTNGHVITITQSGNGYVGTYNDGVDKTAFKITVDPASGAYEYTQYAALDHDANINTISLVFGADVIDYDGDHTSTTITINIEDSVPKIDPSTPTIGNGLELVDETAGIPAGTSASGNVSFDYGTDVPGTFNADGNFTTTAPLKSHGVDITVSVDANGNYVGEAGGSTVFTLTLADNGDYTFSLLAPIDHPDATNPDDLIRLTFGVEVEDSDGDTDSGTIIIDIKDDGPAIVDPAKLTVDEDSIVDSVNGVVSHDFGEDGSGTLVANGTSSFSGVTDLKSNGDAVTINFDANTNTYTGTSAHGDVFTLVFNPATGGYIFTLLDQLDHAQGSDVLTLNFGVTITDYDGDQASANIAIDVIDDKPHIPDPSNPTLKNGYEVVDDTNLGPNVAEGDLVFTYGNDVPGTLYANGTHTTTTPLKSHGVDIVVAADANGDYVGTAGGQTIFTLTLADNGHYVFTQFAAIDHPNAADPNDLIRMTFGYTVEDFDGDKADGTIVIDVLDDGPSIVDPAKLSVDEDQIVDVVNGTVTHDFGQDGSGTLVANGTSSYSGVTDLKSHGDAVTINFDANTNTYTGTSAHGDVFTLVFNPATGGYTFSLLDQLDHAKGSDVLTLNFGVTITDYDGDSAVANIAIDVVDDVPTIPHGDNPTLGEGYEIVDDTNLGPNTASGNVPFDSGEDAPATLSFTGVNSSSVALSSHGEAVSLVATANGYEGKTAGGDVIFDLTLNSATGDYTFNQYGPLDHPDTTNADDVIRLNFGIQVEDFDGDVAGGSIVIDVKDDGPVAHDDTNQFCVTSGTKDYNVALVLDVSGSMSGDKLALLKSSVANLLTDFHDYQGGEIKVHIVPFSTSAQGAETFTITSDADYADALAFLNGLSADGFTNYEAPLQSAISWLNGSTANDPIAGADTYTYFVSDGEPNRYVNGGTQTGTADQVMGEITGSDGTNEVATIQGLSTEVIAVGIGVSATTLARLDIIDSNGNALDVQNPADLDAALQGTNFITGGTDGNVITGVNGGPGAADYLSMDAETTITKVQFGATVVNVDPVTGADINGANGTLHINADGSYTYTLLPTATPDANGMITDQFIYTVVDYDGDPSSALLTLSGDTTCDEPVLATVKPLTVDETDILNAIPLGSDTDSATAVADFGMNGPGTYTATGAATFTYNGQAGSELTSNGEPVTVSVQGNSYVGTANGVTIFTLAINETTGLYQFTLLGQLDHADATNPNDVIELHFGLTATDTDGDTDTGTIVVNVLDDGPDAVDDGSTVLQGTLIANGNVMTNDSTGEDAPAHVSAVTFNGVDYAVNQGVATVVNGQYGVLTINSDGTYSYTSNGPTQNTVTDHFTYTLVDYDGDADTAKLDITIEDRDYTPSFQTENLLVDETDMSPVDTDNGTITADFGNDGPGTFSVTGAGTFSYSGHAGSELTSGGVPVVVTVSGNDYVGSANGAEVFRLSLNSTTGQYEFTLKGTLDHYDVTDPDDSILLNFGVTATDADLDSTNGTIQVTVKDDGPAAHDDVNEFCATQGTKDYNVALVLDVSGSMAGDKLALLKSSVANLLSDFHDYQGGEVKVHLVPFASSAQTAATFTITSDADYAAALVFLNGLSADGFTNYEAPLQSAISWLNGSTANDPIAGADTYTYFVSDGEPNRYVQGGNTSVQGDADTVMGQITGTDGTNEVALIQNLSTEVIAVGIGVSAQTLGRLDIIDSDGNALDVQNPADLDAVLQGTNPITGGADGNVITGENGGPGAADNLSMDADTTVTSIAFGGFVVNVDPVTGADINGANGTLHINADGSYTYTLNNNATPVNGIISDDFIYTITDGDGDISSAHLSLHGDTTCMQSVELKVNNGIDDVIVKEDSQIDVPVTASFNGGDGNEVLSLTLTGVNTSWIVTAPGWVNNGGGTYTLTLPAGQTSYNGSFTFKPPANSDVDMTGLKVTASVYDPDTSSSTSTDDGFQVIVDAVADPITFTASATPHEWSPDVGKTFVYTTGDWVTQSHLNIGNITHPDNDGSESLQKIMIKVPDAVDDVTSISVKNPDGTYTQVATHTTDATGTTYTVDLSGMTYQQAVSYVSNNLYITYEGPTQLDDKYNFAVTLVSYEQNLGGVEVDYTDNTASYTVTVPVWYCISPLVVDMDGDGIELLSQEHGVQFDMTQDGVADQTGWVASDDALLAIDKNGDGTINDRGELFGNDDTNASGFASLAQYDSNGDGVINSDDAVFNELVVWKDANSDGVSQADEILSMNDAGLAEIHLNAQAVTGGQENQGNLVTETSTVVHADGTITEVADVWFGYEDGSSVEYGIALNGTDGRDEIHGSAGADVISGGAGDDLLYGGAGDDTFLFTADDGSVDTIADFEAGHDTIDITALIEGFDALQDSINDFVFTTEVGGNTVISVDADGSAGGAGAVDIAVLQNVTGLDLGEILDLTKVTDGSQSV